MGFNIIFRGASLILVVCSFTKNLLLILGWQLFPTGMHSSLVAVSEGQYFNFFLLLLKKLVHRICSERDSYFTLI